MMIGMEMSSYIRIWEVHNFTIYPVSHNIDRIVGKFCTNITIIMSDHIKNLHTTYHCFCNKNGYAMWS
jgi:hypothetical protein